MRLPTGSAVERAMQCPASCVLSRAGHTGEAAVHGTAQHKSIEDGDLSRDVVRQLLLGADDVRHEVSYALDVERRSVRELGIGLGRAYGALSETEIALTIDVEFWRDGRLWVGDWKSRSRVMSVAENWQVRCAVAAAMTRHAVDGAEGFLAYLDDGEVEVATFDAFDVSAWWQELGAMVVRIRAAADSVSRGTTPDVQAGSWCTYCPALPYCPAHTRLAKSFLGELESIDSALDALTIEQCGRAWELLKRYEVIAERVKDTIRERARREPVPLSNRRHLALIDCKGRKSVDLSAVRARYAELGEPVPMKRGKRYAQVKETKLTESDDDSCDGDWESGIGCGAETHDQW